jgi:photoactive yellow protein
MTFPLSFDTPNLSELVAAMTPSELDLLPFGVTLLDAENIVRIRNKPEADLSAFGDRPFVGRQFFVDVAPCMNNGYFKGRIEKARQAGTLDITFTFVGDFTDTNRELTVRAQSAKDGGTWLFIQRA